MDLLEEERLVLDEDDTVSSPPKDTVAYNEQRSSADLFRLVKSKQLDLSPDFQRGLVWSPAEKTRFVDSLIKGLPIPSMCFSYDAKTEQRIVIDGLQRTSTVAAFLDDKKEWKLSDIEDVDQRIRGKTNIEIAQHYPDLWSLVQNRMIPITVIHCKYDDLNHMEYIYKIFHRLNTNSVKLNNQEVRNGIFNGVFNTTLKELAQSSEAESIYGKSKRFSTEEYILRTLAFDSMLDDYDGKMGKFLNTYMFNKRNEQVPEESKRLKASLKLLAKIAEYREVSSLSRTVLEGVVVGVYSNMPSVKNVSLEGLLNRYDKLVASPSFDPEKLSEGLTSKKKVLERLKTAKKYFKV